MQVAVIIPVYKSIPDWSEKISFNQCLSILYKHPIRIVTHKSLDISQYINILKKSKANYKLEYFDEKYFENIAGYNKLMQSLEFYKRFADFKYILIYQLDAFVFRDELLEWCNKGYDFIGAPWFEGWTENANNTIIGAGNGGFSLRKVSAFLRFWSFLNYFKIQKNSFTLFNEMHIRNKHLSTFNKVRSFIFYLRQLLGKDNNTFYYSSKSLNNEDYFWSFEVPKLGIKFKVAPPSVAVFFAFEVKPSYLFKLTGNKLPFGCHAWNKYEFDFWEQFILNKIVEE